MSAWRPRGSSLGYYLQCSMRAAFDRGLEEQFLQLSEEEAAAVLEARQSSPYADLGTIIHYHTQVRLGATFHKQTAEQAAPTEDQINNAAKLFKNDREKLLAQVLESSNVGMAAIGPGKWIAELRVKRPWVQGHVDLLDPDAGIVVDLKTTTRPPHYTHLSPTHLAQTLAYAMAAEEMGLTNTVSKIRVVYVDSTKGQWWTECEYDPRTQEMQEYRAMLKAAAKNLQKKSLYQTAHPNFASCEWCPYTSLCKDRYAVARGEVHKAVTKPPIKTSNPLQPKAAE